MKHILVCFFLCVSSVGLSQVDSPIVFNVSATQETVPVTSGADGADDICIWTPNQSPEGTLIVGTDKKYGLETYNLNGAKVFKAPFGNINNVDLFLPESIGQATPIVVGTNRSTHSIDFFSLTLQGALSLVHREVINASMGDLYGICSYTYQGHNYFAVSDKEGRVFGYDFRILSQQFDVREIFRLDMGSTTEGLVADVTNNALYVAQEDIGLWRFALSELHSNGSEGNNDHHPELVLATNNDQLKSDFEGLALYDLGKGAGYVIISVQGANKYALIDRLTNNLLGLFEITAGQYIDGVQETDGLDATSVALPGYPMGLLIVQDGINDDAHQNFKFVDWATVQSNLK